MTSHSPELEALVRTAYEVGRCGSEDRALRWLRTVVSILADWGGRDAKAALKEALPHELFSGPGTSGRSYRKAAAQESKEGQDVVLLLEAAERAQQPDPGKVGMTVSPLLGLIKSLLTAPQLDRVVAALPAPVKNDVLKATLAPPYGYLLIPQSYARPEHETPTTSHAYAHQHAAKNPA